MRLPPTYCDFVPVDRELQDRECLGLWHLCLYKISSYTHRLWYTRTNIDHWLMFTHSITWLLTESCISSERWTPSVWGQSLFLLKDSHCLCYFSVAGYVPTPIMCTTEGRALFDEIHILGLIMDRASEPLIELNKKMLQRKQWSGSSKRGSGAIHTWRQY
jgi:hypothetical protein